MIPPTQEGNHNESPNISLNLCAHNLTEDEEQMKITRGLLVRGLGSGKATLALKWAVTMLSASLPAADLRRLTS